MRAADLDLRELLTFDPAGGVIRFAGERVLVFDAVALGLIRRELFDQLGATATRGLLTRFGYAHGWRIAETMRGAFPWDDESEWRRAGGRVHTLQGLVRVGGVEGAPAVPAPFAESVWHDSYEAEQHLLHLGRADEPVCWSLTGFASGYLSFASGREVYAVEDRCRARGDAVCHVVGRFRDDWGDAIAEHLPFYEREACVAALEKLTAELKRVEKRLRARRKELGPASEPLEVAGLVVRSEAMRRVVDLARRVAGVDTTVLLTGESGAGKERLARLVHDESTRAGGPFVAVNCGAVPEALLESELFGHVKGSFTGATQDRVGLFEAAAGGTLFLDEVGEVPPAMQVKLLRALQEREVRRVGENRTRQVDARVVAATNRDLVAEVHAARFREDLYYRLRVIELHVPPLRERRDDILPLARAFLAEVAARTGRRVTGFTPAAANLLVRHPWPGNVRELQNAVERAVVLARGGRVTEDDLPEEVGRAPVPAAAPGEVRRLADVERDHILAALRVAGGNKARAAAALGIGPATLYRKLKQYERSPKR